MTVIHFKEENKGVKMQPNGDVEEAYNLASFNRWAYMYIIWANGSDVLYKKTYPI